MSGDAVFVVNSGSSSLKFGVFIKREGDGQAEVQGHLRADVRALYRGAVEGIGGGQGKIWLRADTGEMLLDKARAFPTEADAARVGRGDLSGIAVPSLRAVGHRVVHGGPWLTNTQTLK